jgi:thiamine pyrophosphate-dependent acetolactate synthase large subunit-like protein
LRQVRAARGANAVAAEALRQSHEVGAPRFHADARDLLPVIVWNNDALKEIVDQMDRQQIPRIGVEPRSPDFMRLAEGFGCHGVRATSGAHLAQAVRDALRADRPTVIEVRQDSPWLSQDAVRADAARDSGR